MYTRRNPEVKKYKSCVVLYAAPPPPCTFAKGGGYPDNISQVNYQLYNYTWLVTIPIIPRDQYYNPTDRVQRITAHMLTKTKTSWWLNQPIWKILVKLEHFPKVRDENKKIFETTT